MNLLFAITIGKQTIQNMQKEKFHLTTLFMIFVPNRDERTIYCIRMCALWMGLVKFA